MDRRRFLDWIMGLSLVGWLGSVLYPVLQFLIPPRTPEAQVTAVKVGTVDEFEPNEWKIFRFGNRPGILIRLASGEFRAFSAVCTHLDCIVQYRADWKLIWCACHNGKYDLNGKNIAGPPPRPLERYEVIVKGNDVYVTREAG